LNSRSDVILPHKKFTWADFGGINTVIHPRRYAPATEINEKLQGNGGASAPRPMPASRARLVSNWLVPSADTMHTVLTVLHY